MIKIPHELVPAVQASDIEEVLYEAGIEVDDLSQFLFGTDFMNDVYKSLYFADDSDPKWDNEAELRNKIYTILREAFPGHSTILVDVSW